MNRIKKRLATLFNQTDVAVTQAGVLNNTNLRFINEPARHKLLDMIGDLALLGAEIQGHIIATKPGHGGNAAFGKALSTLLKESRKPQPPRIDLNSEPLFDINGIMRKLPHRPPFLFIDKIFELSDTHVVGVKNVTMNEEFFQRPFSRGSGNARCTSDRSHGPSGRHFSVEYRARPRELSHVFLENGQRQVSQNGGTWRYYHLPT
jgi:hypothetical protein